MNKPVPRESRAIMMQRTLLCFALALLAGCSNRPHVPEKTSSIPAQPSGRLLSADPSLWEQRGGKAVYVFEAGGDPQVPGGQREPEILGQTRANQPNSFLCTKEEYGDFELTLEFLVDQGLNSGVQVRSQAKAVEGGKRVYGYQVDIDPSVRRWTGGIYDEGRRGWLAPLSGDARAMAAFKPGEWNSMRVRCEGDRLRTWINDVPCADLYDSMTPRGFIALQVHGVGSRSEPMSVRWRRVWITPLAGDGAVR